LDEHVEQEAAIDGQNLSFAVPAGDAIIASRGGFEKEKEAAGSIVEAGPKGSGIRSPRSLRSDARRPGGPAKTVGCPSFDLWPVGAGTDGGNYNGVAGV